MQEEEQSIYKDEVSDQWSDCGVSVWSDSDPEETRNENSSHSNPFTDGARPEEIQDENSSHSNPQNNDGAEPEETKDENSSHSNPQNDGVEPEETQDENSSHSSPQNNDGAEPKETQDESSSHSNPFIYDGARRARATKRKNVILFGETGVGKSSIINLMADAEVAATSSGVEACTLLATEYSFTLSGETPLCIFDTVGLNEPEIGINTFFGAIEQAHRLITSLHEAGGVDLLLFCIRGGRITATTQRNYRLFFEFLCEKKVPLAFIVTNLESHEGVMEDWWARNEVTFEKYGIHSVAHACTTAVAARVTRFAEKRAESRITLQRMLHEALSFPSAPYVQDIRSWFTSMVDMIWSFLMKRLPVSVRRRDLSKKLQTRCGFSRDEAERLADMLTRK